jgi:hypothetical protein
MSIKHPGLKMNYYFLQFLQLCILKVENFLFYAAIRLLTHVIKIIILNEIKLFTIDESKKTLFYYTNYLSFHSKDKAS